ncbi:MAG: Fe-S cluster assembly transcriptional regulator IscR [Gammaproteobacteria bacterium]|nr:MAG: Fe-S cluster assembly transcriptional regulator IscR [Gammaproteobacteria bacterium]
MRLTTKGRYAVTAMLDLAFHYEKGPVTLTEISGRQSISLSYLEQLFARLRKAGLVVGVRGPGGGYRLKKTLEAISIADIVIAVDEVIDSTNCEGKGDCQDDLPCLTHHLWVGLSRHIKDYLQGISLSDLMLRKEFQEVAGRQDKKAEQDIKLDLYMRI